VIQIKNSGDVTLKVYPASGGTVNGGATNAADTITAGSTTIYVTTNGLDWRIPLSGKGVSSCIKSQVVISTTATLAQAYSGSTILVDCSTGYTITLPAVKAGVWYDLVVTAIGGAVVVACPSSATLLRGGILGAGTVVVLAGRNQFTFHASNASIGDRVRLECDGTYWHTRGECTVAAAVSSAS
jgi:hypothetical protein